MQKAEREKKIRRLGQYESGVIGFPFANVLETSGTLKRECEVSEPYGIYSRGKDQYQHHAAEVRYRGLKHRHHEV